MEAGDIPIQPVDALTVPEAREIRENAPTLFLSLIENGKLENVDDIRDLPEGSLIPMGGRASACYFLRDNDQPRVIKFRNSGIEAEAQSLTIWREHGVAAPDVKAAGDVPTTLFMKRKPKFLIMEGIVNPDGEPAKTGSQYAFGHPEALPLLGKLLGTELAKIHGIPTDLPFGSFSDLSESSESLPTLQRLFLKNLAKESSYLRSIGISEEQLAVIETSIKEISFPDNGIIIHGDPGLHNVLVSSEEPLAIKIFDPNPKIHDPYWDIARMQIRQAMITAYAHAHPEDTQFGATYQLEKAYAEAFTNMYWTEGGQTCDEERLLVNEIFRGISPLKRYEKGEAETVPLGFMKKEVPKAEIVELRKKILIQQIQRLSELKASNPKASIE